MNFIIAAETDIGLVKETNQDSLSVKVINSPIGRMAFGIMCDGMGGLEDGEVASKEVVAAFDKWVRTELPNLCSEPIADSVLRSQWERIIAEENEKIKRYGAGKGIRLGTTAAAILLTQDRYYIMNVGDSRVYELTDQIRQLTVDQTFVAREVAAGNMTAEEAERDARRSVLLQCVGASEEVYPDFFFGDARYNAVYMLCCDGLRHEISAEEIYENLQPDLMLSDAVMTQQGRRLIELNKQRGERDNISLAMIRTF